MPERFSIRHAAALAASIFLATAAMAEEPAAPSQPAATAAAKIGKSRSNIQNNREATPVPAQNPPPAAGTEPAQVVKSKTKSNQSND
jgi:hypothetical protein